MSIRFEMIGKLTIGKESESFKPYENIDFNSGWSCRTLKFNLISGYNRFTQTVKGLYKTDGTGTVYLMGKSVNDEKGNMVKGEKITIPWSERLTSAKLENVSEFNKFVVDLEIPKRRWKLTRLQKTLEENGEVSEEDLKDVNLNSVTEIEKALDESLEKRKEFVTEYDFAEYLFNMIKSEKYKDKKFRISGNHKFQYNEKNGSFYESFNPTRIYLANDDDEDIATENAVVYFNQASLVEDFENNKYNVNSKVFVYDSNSKENIPCDYKFSFYKAKEGDAQEKIKKAEALVKVFTTYGEEWKELGVVNDLIDGAQIDNITIEDLDEDIRDNIELGLTTFEDVKKELSGNILGERIKETLFKSFSRGYSKGRKDTAYNDYDFEIKILNKEDDEESLFDDVL